MHKTLVNVTTYFKINKSAIKRHRFTCYDAFPKNSHMTVLLNNNNLALLIISPKLFGDSTEQDPENTFYQSVEPIQ